MSTALSVQDLHPRGIKVGDSNMLLSGLFLWVCALVKSQNLESMSGPYASNIFMCVCMGGARACAYACACVCFNRVFVCVITAKSSQ